MSWEEHDLLGDLEEERPHEFFYEDFVGNSEETEEFTDEDDDGSLDEDFLSIDDIDFSSLDGKNLKSDFKKLNKAVSGKKVVKRQSTQRPVKSSALKKVIVPQDRKLIVEGVSKPLVKPKVTKKTSIAERQKPIVKSKPTAKPTAKPTNKLRSQTTSVPVKKSAVIKSRFGKKTTQRILVPQDRKVIVEGVDKFILSNTKESEAIRNIGYYKGEKLKELVLIINNQTPNDFDLELFNPSMPLDYLFSSGQNLNNRISVAGDNKVQYSDMLFNLLANPTLLPNAKFIVSNGTNPSQAQRQFNQGLIFKNKNIAGHEIIKPIQNNLNIDIDQNQNQIVYWDILQTLGRAYIPDGMDVIQYKVLAGNTVVFGFYYKQVSLKRFFFKEARDKKIL